MRKKRIVAVLLSAVMAVGLFGSIPATQVSAAQNVEVKIPEIKPIINIPEGIEADILQ